MALTNLSPENITKLELSSFCEQMDQMYFQPQKQSKYFSKSAVSQALPSGAHKRSRLVAEQAGRVSVAGLVSAIDLLQSEADNAAAADSLQNEDPQLLPVHGDRQTGRPLLPIPVFPSPIFTAHPLDSTVDWCGQPTSRAQWLKNRVGDTKQRVIASAAVHRPSQTLHPMHQPTRASSARPASAASISAEYRDLSESEVAADVAVQHLGGSSCTSPDERRYWLAAARRPYPIRKSLPSSRSLMRHSKFEFVSLLGPAPDKHGGRPSRLSQSSATAFEPPPASPSSRPATANAANAQQQQWRQRQTSGRPVTGKPRRPAAVASTSDIGDSLSPRVQSAAPSITAALAVVGDDVAKRAPATCNDGCSQKLRQSRQRIWHRLPGATAADAAQPVELQLLGNRLRYHGNGLGSPPSNNAARASVTAADPSLAELELIVSRASRASFPLGPDEEAAPSDETDDTAPVRNDNEEGPGTAINHELMLTSYPSGAEQAAVVIQSGYRGYNTRRRLSRLEQLARGQGFESLQALRRYYCDLMGGAAQHRPDAQEMLNFLDNKRRIELAFDTTIRRPTTQLDGLSCNPNVANLLTKVFNVCGQFPSRQLVEQTLDDWLHRRRRPLDRLAAVEIFYGFLTGSVKSSPRLSTKSYATARAERGRAVNSTKFE